MIYKGTTKIKRVFSGNTEIMTAYKGVNIIFNSPMQGIVNPETKLVIEYGLDNNYQIASKPYLLKLDGHIGDVKGFGLFGLFDMDYWMVGDGDLNFKTINVIDPEKSGTPIGGLLNTLPGIKGNGVDGYINTNMGSSNISKMIANKATHCVYQYEPHTGVRSEISGMNIDFNTRLDNSVSANMRVNGRQVSNNNINLTGDGFKSLSRDGNVLTGRTDTAVTSGSTTVTPEISVNPLLIFNYNNIYGSVGISQYSFGYLLTESQQLDLKAAIINNQ